MWKAVVVAVFAVDVVVDVVRRRYCVLKLKETHGHSYSHLLPTVNYVAVCVGRAVFDGSTRSLLSLGETK